jgi:hypothetical protein
MGIVRYRLFILLLVGLLAAALMAAAFAPRAAARGYPLAPGSSLPVEPTPTPTSTPPPELVGATEVIGWGIVVILAWLVYPLVGLLLYTVALAFVSGDRQVTAQTSAIILTLFAPIYTLIRAGLGGRRK